LVKVSHLNNHSGSGQVPMGAFVSPLYPSAGQDEGRRQAAEHPKSCTLGPHRKTPPTKLASRKPVNARQSGHPSIFSMPGMPIHHPWAGNAPFQCRELDARVVATLTPHMANEGQPPASGNPPSRRGDLLRCRKRHRCLAIRAASARLSQRQDGRGGDQQCLWRGRRCRLPRTWF